MTEEVDKTVEILKKGGVIIYPTDTIWGIGCDASNNEAIEKIHIIKKRLETKTMIVLVSNKEDLKNYVENIPPVAYDLIDSWDRPLTIVYNGAKNLAKSLIREDKTIAIRVSKGDFCNRVIEKLGRPIISTSANKSGEKAPIFFREIDKEILDSVDYVVDLYHDSMNDVKPSTIIKLDIDGNFEVLRS